MVRLVLDGQSVVVTCGVDKLRALGTQPPDEYIVKSSVSMSCLRKFVELVDSTSHDIGEDMLTGLQTLSEEFNCDYVRRLCIEQSDSPKGSTIEPAHPCEHALFTAEFAGAAFDGLFKKMFASAGKNPVSAGLVKITGTSYDRAMDELLPHVIESHWDEDWISKNTSDAFLCFDFMANAVTVTAYAIRTYNAVAGMSHLKSWILEGSCDHEVWTKIDRRRNSDALNSKSKACVFLCRPADRFNAIRLRSTGPDHSGTHFLALTSVELFGVCSVADVVK